jgi:hypothetical protein
MSTIAFSGSRRFHWHLLAGALALGAACVTAGCAPEDVGSSAADAGAGSGGTGTGGLSPGSGGTITAGSGGMGTGGTIPRGSGGAGTGGAGTGGAGTGGAAPDAGVDATGLDGGGDGARPDGGGSGGRSGTGGAAGTGGRQGTGGRGGTTGGSGGAGGGGTAYNPCPTNGDPCEVLPLGDSITFGLGGESNGNGGYRIDLFSRAVMAGKRLTFVGSQMNGPMTVAGMMFPSRHEGFSGYTIDQIAARVPNPALAMGPHIILLHIGTNDMYMANPGGAPQRLAALLDKIITNAPDALLVVARIIPLSSGMAAVNTYNNAIPPLVQERAAAGKHIILVDQNTGFPTSELGDGVHPNAAGYRRMAGVWYAAIGGLLP